MTCSSIANMALYGINLQKASCGLTGNVGLVFSIVEMF